MWAWHFRMSESQSLIKMLIF